MKISVHKPKGFQWCNEKYDVLTVYGINHFLTKTLIIVSIIILHIQEA